MAVTMMRQDFAATLDEFGGSLESSAITELGHSDQSEVIEFLSARPVHTVFMLGLIRDNGLLSPRNRGSFYGSRSRSGQLEGVALIGHATMVEARTENSLVGFARVARNCQNAHLIRGEQESTDTFWRYYSDGGREPRLISREHLFELSETPSSVEDVDLRPAIMEDLERVLAVNSSMALEEGGTSPLQRDPSGFRRRTARRIEQNRVWVWCDENRLIFKADVVSETPAITYLEGIYVHQEERRKGHGLRCLKKLSSILLTQTNSICLTVNNRNQNAVACYNKAGFKFHSHYETIYLR